VSIYEYIDDFILQRNLEFLSEAAMPLLEAVPGIFNKPTISVIQKAVDNRQYAGIYYEEPSNHRKVLPAFRVIEPYTLGKGVKYGDKVYHEDRYYLSAYVIMDTDQDPTVKDKFKTKRTSKSLTNRKPYWRMFRVDRIQNWQTFEKIFSGYRELYNPHDTRMGSILAGNGFGSFPTGMVKGG
jgi:hypothetical protein